jgi:hypothetical protein
LGGGFIENNRAGPNTAPDRSTVTTDCTAVKPGSYPIS